MFRHTEAGAVEVSTWSLKVPKDAFKVFANACKEDRREEEDLPHWTRNVIGRISSQVLEDAKARHVVIESIMWSRDFFRHEVGETEGRGAITFTEVRKHNKLFPVEDFLWQVSANLEEDERRTG